MGRKDGCTTNPSLLKRIGDWRNSPAWHEFVCRYDRLLRSWCRDFGLDYESTDEVVQRIWIELARRLPTFRYDPGGSFRGWLRSLCYSRSQDLLRERRRVPYLPLEGGQT
jgi:RNA polymerase sigma-70 factor (ECF subfamily)